MQIKIIFSLLFCLKLQIGFCQTEWKYFSPTDSSFTVLLPGQPMQKTKQLHTALGMLPFTNYSYAIEKYEDNFLYSINVVTYPDLNFEEDSIQFNETVMKASVEALSVNLKCEVVYVQTKLLDDENGMVFRLMDNLSGQVVKGQIGIKNDKMYTLTVFTMKDKSLNDNMDKFLDSFHFTGRQ